jgi:hypothetical protein
LQKSKQTNKQAKMIGNDDDDDNNNDYKYNNNNFLAACISPALVTRFKHSFL